jgi:hypothetical protein
MVVTVIDVMVMSNLCSMKLELKLESSTMTIADICAEVTRSNAKFDEI